MDASFGGIVRSGLGTGASYVIIPHFFGHFLDFLGSAPYPGTLNVQLARESLPRYRDAIANALPLVIPASRVDGRDLWRISCYRVSIGNEDRGGSNERGLALDFDSPQHPRDVVELVSHVHLRQRFGLADGDRLCFTVIS
ncbi:MAG: DUF120 domain-containing protein [Candidatus Lokiarchaeota archaeon]|nr:DUF120 domain-containing protein [Candidatus Lokiarchaeota archaeon]